MQFRTGDKIDLSDLFDWIESQRLNVVNAVLMRGQYSVTKRLAKPLYRIKPGEPLGGTIDFEIFPVGAPYPLRFSVSGRRNDTEIVFVHEVGKQEITSFLLEESSHIEALKPTVSKPRKFHKRKRQRAIPVAPDISAPFAIPIAPQIPVAPQLSPEPEQENTGAA